MDNRNVVYLLIPRSIIKPNEALTQVKIWKNLENMLNERNHTQKATYCMIPLHKMSTLGRSRETDGRLYNNSDSAVLAHGQITKTTEVTKESQTRYR